MENDRYIEELNSFLVDVFNGILKTEELYVTANCPDLSLREIHLIEEVCRAVDQGRDNRASAIAAAQQMGDRLMEAGVRGIWNFTNYELACSRPDVVVESVHFSDSLLTLSYLISQRENMEENP